MPNIPDITQLYNSPDIQQAQQQSQQAAATASNYQSAAAQLPTALKKAIEEKLNYNKDIIDAQAKAQSNYFAAPAQARSDYQNIFNPFDREALVAKATANAYAPYQSLTDILGQRQGNITDIVNAGVGAFNSQVGAEQNNAQISRQNFQDMLSQADRLASAKEWMYSANIPTGSGSAQYQQKQSMDNLVKDARGGNTLQQIMRKYSTDLDPDTILQLYNVNSRYGPAKESPDTLQHLFGTQVSAAQAKAVQTQQEAKQAASFSNDVADQIYGSWKKMSPVEKTVASLPGIDKIPGITPNYANMQSLFYGDLLEGIRKAGIGGRITQFEINWMKNYLLPSPGDSDTTAKNKINAMKQALNKKVTNPNYEIGSETPKIGSNNQYKIIQVK